MILALTTTISTSSMTTIQNTHWSLCSSGSQTKIWMYSHGHQTVPISTSLKTSGITLHTEYKLDHPVQLWRRICGFYFRRNGIRLIPHLLQIYMTLCLRECLTFTKLKGGTQGTRLQKVKHQILLLASRLRGSSHFGYTPIFGMIFVIKCFWLHPMDSNHTFFST